MPTRLFFAALLLIFAASFSFAQSKSKNNGVWLLGIVESVHDGDTFRMKSQNGGQTIKVRMFGLDAPEIAQEYGKESGDALRDLINGKEIRLFIHNTDRYGRSVGEAWLGDSVNVSLWMIENGNGWHYKQYSKKRLDFEYAENEAKSKKLGLWSSANLVPPWEFRKMENPKKTHKKKKKK